MKIVVIEDHAIIQGLIQRVSDDTFPSAEVICTKFGWAGVELCRDCRPDLVLLDLDLPDADGLDLVPRIRAVAAEARILILSAHTEDYVLHRVQKAAVEGFVDKSEQTPEMLMEALRALGSGQRYFSRPIQAALARIRADPKSFSKVLSEREQELLRLLGQGLSDQMIADRIELREITVRNHRRNIMAKLGIHSTPELIRYAMEHGFSRLRAAS